MNRSNLMAELLTGEAAKKVLGEILESERLRVGEQSSGMLTNRTLSFPAHTGARGYFYEKPKFVAFDNSSNDCWVEEFRTKMGAEKWCRGAMGTDQVHEMEVVVMRDRRRSLEFRKQCRDIAKQLNGRASGGDSDGVAYFLDKPFIATFTEDEMTEGWDRMRFAEEEIVIGAYFSDNRVMPADYVILQRGNRIDAEQMPHYGLSMYRQLASYMKVLAERPGKARDQSIRVMDNDSTHDFTLAEVIPANRSAHPKTLEDTSHYETFLHALESGRRRLLAQQGVRCQELDCPKGYVSNILLNKWSFSLLHKDGIKAEQFFPPYVKFDDSGEFSIDMEFHDGFAYDLNPHGLGFYDRVALYYPTMEEVLADPLMKKAIQKYTGRTEITPYDVALKYGQASRMCCPDYRYEAAKKAVVERATDPSAREFTPEQRKAIELAADCGGFYGRPKGRDFFYDALFCNAEPKMGDIPKAWKADVTAELRKLARGETREEHRGLHR